MTNKIERHDKGRLPAGRIKDNVDTSQGKREKGILEKRDSLRKGTTSMESHRAQNQVGSTIYKIQETVFVSSHIPHLSFSLQSSFICILTLDDFI